MCLRFSPFRIGKVGLTGRDASVRKAVIPNRYQPGALPAPAVHRSALRICAGPEAGFPSSVPYTEILFFHPPRLSLAGKRFRFLYRTFHPCSPVFFWKCSGSVREGFGNSRTLPEETPKKPRIQSACNPPRRICPGHPSAAPKSTKERIPVYGTELGNPAFGP